MTDIHQSPLAPGNRTAMATNSHDAACDHPGTSLRHVLADYVSARGGYEGHFPLLTPGTHILHCRRQVLANHMLYKPSLCIVVQGIKQILLEDRMLEYGAMQCLIVSVERPACGRIVEASAERPFLGISMDFDISAMREVLTQLDLRPSPADDAGPTIFVADIDARLADCFMRLVRMSETPKAIPVLYPAVIREIYYWLLTSPQGAEICRQLLPEAHASRIALAIQLLRENFATTLRVERLADAARMSPSLFHQRFKALTSTTPLQFQKQLRLLEARRLMLADALGVAEAAHRVGYESASQFSREYARMFGMAPKRDVSNMRAAMA